MSIYSAIERIQNIQKKGVIQPPQGNRFRGILAPYQFIRARVYDFTEFLASVLDIKRGHEIPDVPNLEPKTAESTSTGIMIKELGLPQVDKQDSVQIRLSPCMLEPLQ